MAVTQYRKRAWPGARLAGYALLLALLLISACSSGEGETWRRIEAEGVLRVGLDPTYPPFAETVGDQVQGLDVDLARALAEELGLDARFTYFGYDGLYDALATEQVDVLISALVIRPEQTRDFAYSDPYFNAGQILLVPPGSPVEGRADLEGRTLAVELGAEGHVLATEWQRQVRDLDVSPYNTPEEALNAVRDGQAAAGLVDAISGRLYLREHAGLEIAGEPVTVEPFALVVRKEDQVLLEQLDAALGTLETTGRLDAIHSRWLDP